MATPTKENVHIEDMQLTVQPPNRTRTLAADYYTSDAVLAAEKKHLFFKTWQFACHVSELAGVGAYKALTIFDQNIVLLRTPEDQIKGYFNVCPHRGHQLVEGCGQKRALTCPYHAWTFGLNGQFIGARGVQSENSAELSDIRLFDVRVELLLDLVFVNLDPDAQPLAEFAPGLAEQMMTACPEARTYEQFYRDENEKTFSSVWNANWKLLIDNFLECYHCETAHPGFSSLMCIPDTVRTVHQNFTHEVTQVSTDPEKWPHPIDPKHDVMEAHFWFLFPNTAIGRAAGVPNFYISRFDPLSPEQTVRTTTLLRPAELPDPDAARRARLRTEWSMNSVGPEDKALCENVQKGMHQLGYQQGWYVTDPDAHNISEHALRYFHDLYLAQMEAEA